MPKSHSGCGYNFRNAGGMSAHNVFVLGVDGKPLTPTTNSKARKLMKGKQAKPVWNKFGRFGIQMLTETRKHTPRTALGIDFGTKFEGYTVATEKENNLSVMWKIPDKKKIVKKLEKRKTLRRARRWRNCRRRKVRFDNRSRKDFIAPSQKVIIHNRLKAIKEFFKCYPIDTTAIEDVRFNHRDNRWGKNFSTVEIGKSFLYNWIRKNSHLQMFTGTDTQRLREEYGYKKSSSKDAEIFNSHCSDALSIALGSSLFDYVKPDNFIIVDDTYRPVRRSLHDTQPAKGNIREKYSAGNFKGVRKGTMCNFGQIVGGTKNNFWIRNWENKRIGRTYPEWFSKRFKTKEIGNSSLPLRIGSPCY